MKKIIYNYHLLSPGFDLRKIGLFTFFKELKVENELTPIPPKVKTGILKSFSICSSFVGVSCLGGESI